MVRRLITVGGADAASVEALTSRFDQIRAALGVPVQFPDEVVTAAGEAAEATLPEVERDVEWTDLRDLALATVDPVGSTDLDQAMALARRDGGGWHVDYAIADVPAFLPPGGPVDAEARRRGQTLYAPDRRVPLHPERLSEDAASLLPDQDRPAFVWRLDLAADGTVASVDLVRAVVRSRARLDYGAVQAAADANPLAGQGLTPLPDDALGALAVLLREIGIARQAQERARGGASLPLPEQEVLAQDGHYRVELRPSVAAEDWNAQLSLMTGMAAAQIMLAGGIGLLRTMPAPPPPAIDRFRRQVAALGVTWPQGQPYGEFLRGLDRAVPAHLAAMHAAASLFRGAGYTPFDGAAPAVRDHAAVAAPYAHVTAPLRRLVDRFGLLVSHALASGTPVPQWVRAALPELPATMAASDQLAGELDRRCLDVVEAAVLADRVGQVFDAVAVDGDREGKGGKVQLLDPAVLVRAQGPLTPGAPVKVRLEAADPDTGQVRVVPVA